MTIHRKQLRSRGATYFRKLLRQVVCLYTLALLYLSSGSIELFKEGGARPQNASYVDSNTSAFDSILVLWFITSIPLIFVVLSRSRRLLQKVFDVRFASLLLLAAASLAWSLDRYTAIRTLALMAACYLMVSVYVVLHEETPSRMVRQLVITIFLMQLSSLGFCLFVPSYGISVGNELGAWQGIFSHKNNLGNFSAMSFCLVLGFLSVTRRPILYFTLIISFILTWMSESSTSIAAVVGALLLFLCLKNRLIRELLVKNRRKFLFMLLGLSFGAVALAIAGVSVPVFGKDTTFSNRNAIWGFLLYKILDRPLFGYGINQFAAHFVSTDMSFYNNVGFLVSHAHNGFLDVLYSLGITGFALVLAILTGLLPRSSDSRTTCLCIVFVLVTVLINTFEVRLLTFSFGFFGICLVYNIRKSWITRSAATQNLLGSLERGDEAGGKEPA